MGRGRKRVRGQRRLEDEDGDKESFRMGAFFVLARSMKRPSRGHGSHDSEEGEGGRRMGGGNEKVKVVSPDINIFSFLTYGQTFENLCVCMSLDFQ